MESKSLQSSNCMILQRVALTRWTNELGITQPRQSLQNGLELFLCSWHCTRESLHCVRLVISFDSSRPGVFWASLEVGRVPCAASCSQQENQQSMNENLIEAVTSDRNWQHFCRRRYRGFLCCSHPNKQEANVSHVPKRPDREARVQAGERQTTESQNLLRQMSESMLSPAYSCYLLWLLLRQYAKLCYVFIYQLPIY